MKRGYLSQYFDGVALKRLSSVEVDMLHSHQHEFNGDEGLRKILGEPDGKLKYDAKFLYLTDSNEEPVIEDGFLTWYDARQKARLERGVMRWEYRLYFSTNIALQLSSVGDLLLIAKRPDNTLLAIVAEQDTTIAKQLIWLFGFSSSTHPSFSIREDLETEQDRIEFASRFILESIGIVVESTEETLLDAMLEKFNGGFPTTKVFSDYARSTLKDANPQDGLDDLLMAWLEREEILFRTLERHLIGDRLTKGFDGDVESFISFSLSVQNRRKSRVGLALENHLEQLFVGCGLRYSRTAVTENKTKPDFLFPGHAEYHNPDFNPLKLTMLGVKTTCKDRWRQVLAEANRIEHKHLLTFEAAISTNQTDEMHTKNLQLVVPRRLHESYTETQRTWLMDVSSFISLVQERQ